MNQSFKLKTAAVAVRNWIDPNIIQFKATSPSLRNPIRPRWRRNALLIIVFALSNFALLAEVKAVSATDTYFGTGAFNATSTGDYDSAFGYYALHFDTTGNYNTATGAFALDQNNSGSNNTADGVSALNANTTGVANTATGAYALESNTFASNNTADGFEALNNNREGVENTATGAYALESNTFANKNTADGFEALYANTAGLDDTATGAFALESNTSANYNTADGSTALYANTTGFENTATGAFALESNTTANDNTADGFEALVANTTGLQNTATGAFALERNTTANNNTADGFQALLNNTVGSNNTAVGYNALLNSIGNNNIAIGNNAGSNLTTGSNNIDIGAFGTVGESNAIRIGKGGLQTSAYMQGIRGSTVASGVTVIVGSDGHLGTVVSSARFKDEIKPMNKLSEAILALKPVTFRYKKSLDPEGIPQFGLVAEQVARVNPDLVARDDKGEIYSVRYEAVNAMLLNEFLKEHRKVEQQEGTIAQLKRDAADQRKQIEALTAGLQKVSAQLELRKPAPQTVKNID